MPSLPATDQAIRLARRATLWMVGPIVLLLRGPLAGLAPPAQCVGALDFLSIIAVRAWPQLQVGALFSALQAVALTAAFGCFAEFTRRVSGSMVIAGALTITLGISQLFGRTFAPPWTATAFGACVIVLLALRACLRAESPPRPGAMTAWTALAFAAAVVPPWTASCAVLALALTRRSFASSTTRARASASAIASAIVVGIPLVIAKLANDAGLETQWTTCLWPGVIHSQTTALGDAFAVTGPLVFALGALGVYVAVLRAGPRRTAFLAAVLALAIVPALGAEWPRGIVFMPILVGVWSFAGAGLREVLTYAPRRGAAVFAALAIAAVPILQLSRGHVGHDSGIGLLGHDRASLAQVRRLLNLVPAGSTLVEEDASVDLLLRAASFGNRRSSKPLAVVPPVRNQVVEALKTSRVYAFPLGQRELSLRGFAIDPVTTEPRADARGIAAVSGLRACVELGRTWANLEGVGVNGRAALFADSELATGPVVVYFSGTSGYTPGPDGWSPAMMPGFDLRMFDRNTPARAALMDAEAAAAGLAGHPVFGSPYVARLMLSRTPQAPLALPIVLGPPRALGVGRLVADDASAPSLTICDAPNIATASF